ncbi:hypothetical protein QCA50_016590 [Cerrena zonata]|uniref:Glycoside hydrolase family 5 domain-containing protein n=1 Tax=Cerrena zonata TaxID=2478898 RepID=A0AAW0FUE5_9APHY
MSSTIPSDLDASFVLVNDDPTSSSILKKPAGSNAGPTFAHDWSARGTGGRISQRGRHFVDALGRVCNLRGVNLSGSCKTPAHDTFPDNPAGVTFVNRPFPLEEAPEHFARLRRWGLTFVRFLVTWEAVEHAGPGEYDYEYLNYLKQVISLMPQYGLSCFVALHQDVWSRYTGGSGAPAWTIQLAGFDLDALEETGSAWLKGVQVKTAEGEYDEEDRGDVKPEERGTVAYWVSEIGCRDYGDVVLGWRYICTQITRSKKDKLRC